jgi:tetratricopeptide (TPR) repeat protein
MKRIALCAALCFAILPASGQQRYKFQLNAETPEGQLLQAAGQEEDESKKLALYTDFLAKHASHEGAAYAWAQAQPLLLKAGQLDQVVKAAEEILKVDPYNAPAAYNALQAMEKKNDVEGIKTWSGRTVESAKKVLTLSKPEDEDDVETWTREVDYAKQVITRCEYALYAPMLQSNDPAAIVTLGEALVERHPDSQYIPQILSKYFWGLQQSGQKEKAVAFAEKRLETDKSNPEMMLVVADYYMQSKKSPEKVLEYSQLLVETAGQQAAPEGVDAAAWEKRKNTLVGLGYWMTGMTYAGQNKWVETDKAFRDGLPFLAGNNDLLGPAYFYLGLANYNLSRAGKGNPKLRAEARRFNELCSAIKGPYQQRAIQNLNAINAGK